MGKFVYSFNEGSKDMRDLLGSKGANLAEMTMLGLPVPFGFTITTEVCTRYYDEGQRIGNDIIESINEKLSEIEEVSGKKFGDEADPLLVSVRSGAGTSMPGMMDTILNLGLNDETVDGLANTTNNLWFALDSYRRFIQMYSQVVMDVPKRSFDAIFEGTKIRNDYDSDDQLTTDDLQKIIIAFKDLVRNQAGRDFPQDVHTQLMEAIKAVFKSWNNDRAVLFRKINKIPDGVGTAVTVQLMVFGNKGKESGTGVAFSRNAATGENVLFGEFLVNSQGEEVVSGTRTPEPIEKMAETFPDIYDEFLSISRLLENHYKDMQDMEFTIEEGQLYMLQTRPGRRTATAAVKMAVDMVAEGLIDEETAVNRIEPEQIDHLLHPKFDADERKNAVVLAKGLPASPGAATGRIYFSASAADEANARGVNAILVRRETSPEDLIGIVAADGILTQRGGITSHAAVVARGMGRCCVSGCSSIRVDEDEKTLAIGERVYHEGDFISLDGTTGHVLEGKLKTVPVKLSGDFGVIMEWADDIRSLKVRTNADNAREAQQALDFGAEGIGLCRTEHMFFDEDRIPALRKMILADTEEEREEAIQELLPYQKEDFKSIYEVMCDRPVTIRLLDPPLREFIPQTEDELEELAIKMNKPLERVKRAANELHENNPMLGHRGCRLAITYPRIAEMQTEAIITAALEIRREKGLDIIPEIMVPLVGYVEELKLVKSSIVKTIDDIFEREGEHFDYRIGTMIEIPRAALIADEIAEEAEFFSFGTNDLTQMTLGFSRDDASKTIEEYRDKNILEEDPFCSLDEKGVGKLISTAVELGRQARPNVKLGICGEHGGDPKSIAFCNDLGLNYVSCSPYRVPIARLAAAQAAIKQD